MLTTNDYKSSLIGLLTGIVASFVGGGAEILIAPLLIYFNVFQDYKTAVGTSLASLLLPIGIVAVYFYSTVQCNDKSHRTKSCVHWRYAILISLFFVLGTFASYYSVQLDNTMYKKVFAGIMIILGIILLLE
jgi:uncharacterized membrane protein YfcA